MRIFFAVEFLLVMLILFVGKGHGLKCYECRSDIDDGCSSSMNISLSRECTPKDGQTKMYCRKIQQKLKFKDEKSWTSIRECAYERQSSDCYHFKWIELGYQEICECAEENCNRGKHHFSDILTVAVVFSLTWIFNYLKSSDT